MTTPKFSAGLFEQLGGTNWIGRPVFFESQLTKTQKTVPQVIESPSASDTVDSGYDEERMNPGLFSPEPEPVGLILIGSGLNSIWEDEEQLEWQLWLNICEALNWPEDQIAYYDTEALISEEMLFSTMEEIVASGVDCVLSMKSDSELSEQLSEGLQVIEVPSLQDMLVDPYAKQSFYQSVITSVNLP